MYRGAIAHLCSARWECSTKSAAVQGLFNFRPAVRPVPLEAHIQGYPGKFYCPRMASMNKPSYAAIQSYSREKPVLIFVSSRRQTRLTALDLIAFAAADMRPNQWMHMGPVELEKVRYHTTTHHCRSTIIIAAP